MKQILFICRTLFLLFFIHKSNAYTLDNIKLLAKSFENDYSIKIHFEDVPKSSWNIKFRTAKPQNYKRLYNYLLILHQEFSKYPKSFLQQTNLKEIVLVYHLNIYNQYRAAIPDYYLERLYYDFNEAWHKQTYQRHVIHHEFYHMIEQEFNGDAFWFDQKWNSFNIKNTFYGKGGVLHQNNQFNYYELNHPSTGFINLYSKSGLEEDKAEIFAILFVEEEFQIVSKWLKKDQVLRNKIEYMKTKLLEYDPNFNFNNIEQM